MISNYFIKTPNKRKNIISEILIILKIRNTFHFLNKAIDYLCQMFLVQFKKKVYYRKYKSKFIIIMLLILIFSLFNSLSNHNYENSKYIFTFWEPNNKVPGYLNLCIKTWKKYLPDYNIIILNYSSLKNYLNSNFISKILCKKMSLPNQADAIRIALLYKYGGIWMDMDTIITDSKFLEIFKGINLAMFGDKKSNSQHIGFIYASKSSKFLKIWLNRIIKKVSYYRFINFLKNYLNNHYIKRKWKQVNIWNYLGNGIIDEFLINASKRDYLRIEMEKMHIHPEYYFVRNGNVIDKYQNFFFSRGNAEKLLNFSKGLILLHNSWTPTKYKNISETKLY